MAAAITMGAIVVFLLLMVYMSVGAMLTERNASFGHEASFTVVVGMMFSLFYWKMNNEDMMQFLKFDDTAFFFFCLPPIVFASGFNMRRSNFFANFKNTLIFGVFGTFIAFFSFSALTIWLKNLDFMK